MRDHKNHGPTNVAGTGDKGGFGRGDFGPGPARGVVRHIIEHPSRQSAPNEELGAEPLAPERLVAAVQARLAAEQIPSTNIDIHREGREIYLEGLVPSEQHRRLAEILARGTPGVTDVHCTLTLV